MRTLAHATLLAVCVSTLAVLVACGSSSNSDGQATGGAAASTGGNLNVGGTKATGGAIATGGTIAAGGATTSTSAVATGGAATGGVATGGAATGGAATGGSPAIGGTATTGGNAPVGGSSSAGGTATLGGSTGTGGSTGVSDVTQMCSDVCTLLAGRSPQLTCVPTDCVGTCNSTFAKLRGAKAACADDYAALYQCGLGQPVDSWGCLTLGGVNIPTPFPQGSPQAKTDPCYAEYQALYNVIIANMQCLTALSQ